MTKPDLLVLLGSGATMPQIPGVAQLTTLLRQFKIKSIFGKKRSNRVFDQIAKLCERRVDTLWPKATDVVSEPALDLWRDERLRELEGKTVDFHGMKLDLAKLLEGELHAAVLEKGPRPDAKQRTVNFEDLLGVAESLSSYHENFANLFLERSQQGPALPDLEDAYEQGCYHVLTEVSKACDKVEGTKLPLVDGLERLSEHFRLHVFSLNYDDIPEHSKKINFFNGYDVNRESGGHVLGSPRFFPVQLYQGVDNLHRRGQHLHLQMHGSVLFGPAFEQVGILARFPDRASARDRWQMNAAASRQTQGGGSRPHLPMVTGYGKSEATLWEPFGTYLAALRRTAMLTQTWLIIGYGGSDAHVNACLNSAMMQAVGVNHLSGFRHAVLVDFYSFARERRLDFDERDPIGHILINKIFKPWAQLDIFDPNSYEFLRSGTYFRPKAFNRISKRLSVSLDGTAWALGDGMDALLERLLAFQRAAGAAGR